ncbi:solute carrier family 23 protein [Psychrobacter submarinus]|jgi:hypothetical protein|uniref:solute carrier family 23 protein n=1 Tax=Psychrobacter submarinus TaxID=154108 RepID=UPI0019180FD2|nr:solute carrier family 23 protein [Psychrobacter submarinus]
MAMNRKYGEEQPYWPAGPFKIRLPFIHYRWEIPEMIQGLFMFVVGLGMIPLLEQYLGMSYDAAIAFCVIAGFLYLLPVTLGIPLVPGWITPAIPIVLLYLQAFEPGPAAVQAMFVLQLEVFIIFIVLGITGFGNRLVNFIPNSLKAGIIIGAGIAALMGEIKVGGRIEATPISLIIGAVISACVLFSVPFKHIMQHNRFARILANLGMISGMLVAMVIGWLVGEYPLPNIEWGITNPDFDAMTEFLVFNVGVPDISVFLFAFPTAMIAYVIAFGDILVGKALSERVDSIRPDEKIETNITRIHVVTGIRNGLHALFAPWPGLAGPLWTAAHATLAERYALGRKAMDSIYSGGGTFWWTGLIALFILPLVTFFKPVLPIALSLTLLLTAYICIMVGIEQLKTSAERGVAGIVAVTLAMPAAQSTIYAVAIGVVLYLLIERPTSRQRREELEASTANPNVDPTSKER